MAETKEIKLQVKEVLYEIMNENANYYKNILREVLEDYVVGKATEYCDIAEYIPEKTVLKMLKD